MSRSFPLTRAAGRRAGQAAAFVTTLALAVTAQAGPAGAALPGPPAGAVHRAPAPRVPPDKRVPFRRQAPRELKQRQGFRRYDPRADSTLPGPGSASIDLAIPAGRMAAVPRHGLHRVGSLPVLAGPAASPSGGGGAGTAPARLTVRVTSRRTARAAGIHGILFSVTSPRPGPVTVGVDDSSFAAAFGGGYASRLHLVRLPDCALTSPRLARCQRQTPLPPVTVGALTARVTLGQPAPAPDAPHGPGQAPGTAAAPRATGPPPSPALAVLAATSGTDGSSGTYSATSLSPAGTWSAGNTGSFDYRYPVSVPKPIGGPAPNVDLSYDSSSQDGRTAGTNDQSSWIGDGWTSADNFIERTYGACSDDATSGAPQYSGDLCWKGQVLTMSLNGVSTPVVYDDTTHAFHPVADSATTKIEQLTSCQNGTYDNECWRVTENGVQYYFGLNELPGWSAGDQATQSAWTVPVYGAHAGDPCHAGTFAASACLQGWRWNLDYVVDLHQNATAYYYTPEYNNYGADMQTTPVKYTRGGYLSRIDYGMTANTIYSAPAPEQIVFNAGQRCVPGNPSGNTCADSQFTVANAAYWPDVPIDLDCWSNNASSCPIHGPSFWSRLRLASIVTQVRVNGAVQKVDEYDLTQSYPDGGDHAPTLWLDSIQHTGLDTSGGAAGPVSDPPVSFDPPLQLANRVGTIANLPAMYHDRIQDITTETGAQITVTYNPASCTPSNVPADPSANTANCFPVYWAPYGATAPRLDWFQKYTVHSVLTQDPHNANPDGSFPELLTTYKYPANGAAWHYDDDELVKPAYRTYGQFRGYAWVEALTGDPGVFHYTDGAKVYDQQTLTKTTYLRGMSSDTPSGTGGTTVTVSSSDGKYSVTDANALAGQVFETDTYTDASGSGLYSATVNVPVIIGPTASRARDGLPALTAQMVRASHSYTRQAVSYSPGWRYTETGTFYNTTLGQPTTGMPVQIDDRGETADPANIATCTWIRYAENTSETLVLPAEKLTSAQDCTSAAATQTGPLISDTRTSYDGHAFTWDGASPAGAAPTNGDATATSQASGPAGAVTAPAFTTMSATTYDSYGRPLTVTRTPGSTAPGGSSLAQASTTSYTPATGALPAQIQVKTQVTAGSSPTYQSSTTKLDARGLPTEKVDPAGLQTDLSYDAMGRVTATWLPNESKAAGDPANDTFSYKLSQSGPTVVTTGTLLDDGSYQISKTLYDALLRPRQTQMTAENGGTIVSDTQYNSLGKTVLANTAYAINGSPGDALVAAAPGSIPDTTVTDYDGMGRADLVTEEHDGAKTWATITAYAGDHTTVIPPSGGITQATYTNARGQTTALDQYTAAPSVAGTSQAGYTASGGSYNQTSYTYTPAGQQATVTGPDKTSWSFSYDLLGRRTRQSSPDTGTTTFGYDDAGDLTSTTDARGIELDFTYDLLGRKLTATDKANNGFEFASWLWDTLQAGKLTSETRYVPGTSGGYTVATTGYTSLGKPAGTKITLPAAEAPLPASYTTSYGYSVKDQRLTSQTDQRTQGLAGETISYGHDSLGRPTTTSGINTYVGGIVYTSYGEPSRVTLGDSANPAYLTYAYDDQTRRITGVQTDRTQAPGPTVDHTTYTYDASGNPTSVSDQQSETGSTVTDTQCYTYDALGRLTQAWTDAAGVNAAGTGGIGGCQTTAPSTATLATGPAAYWQTFAYDAAGDRTSETDHAAGGAVSDTTTAYTNGGTPPGNCPDATARPHTLTQTSTPAATTAFCYNAAGDVVSRTPSNAAAQALTWDDQGNLASVTQGSSTTRYLYDADGNLLIRRDPGRTTLFAGDTEIVVNTSVTPSVLLGAARTYSPGGTGAAIAVRSSLPGGGVDYLLSDPHGTATMAMDITTQAVSRTQYTPYGQVLATTGAWPDPSHGYLGKPADTGTGYTTLGAREYDPTLGRFLSHDSLLETGSPQQLGGYTYAADNPVNGSDPTGLAKACEDTCGPGDPGEGNPRGGSPGGGGNACWGPGGIWECGTEYITVTPPGGGTPVTVRADQPVFPDPNKTAQMVLDYRSIQGPSGYKGSSDFTYGDALAWAQTSETGWEKFCGALLGWTGNQCKADTFSRSKNIYAEADGEYATVLGVTQGLSCLSGVLLVCGAATGLGVVANSASAANRGESGRKILTEDALYSAPIFIQGLAPERVIEKMTNLMEADENTLGPAQQKLYNFSARLPFAEADPMASVIQWSAKEDGEDDHIFPTVDATWIYGS